MENVTDVNRLIDTVLEERGSQCLEVLQQYIQQQYVSNKVSKTEVQNAQKPAKKTRIEWIPPF